MVSGQKKLHRVIWIPKTTWHQNLGTTGRQQTACMIGMDTAGTETQNHNPWDLGVPKVEGLIQTMGFPKK